jgi:hypothetical protein
MASACGGRLGGQESGIKERRPAGKNQARTDRLWYPSADRLLAGEDRATGQPDDARHWISVYTELVRFREQTLSDWHEEMAGSQDPRSRAELSRTLVAWSSRQLEALRQHLDFWRRRHLQLLEHPAPSTLALGLNWAALGRPRQGRARKRAPGARKDRRPGRAAGPGR